MKEMIRLEKKIAGAGTVKLYYAVRSELSALNLSGAIVAERNGDGEWTLVHATKRGYKSLLVEALIRAGLDSESKLVRMLGGVFCQGEAARLARLLSFACRADNGKRKLYIARDTVKIAHERAVYLSGNDDKAREYNARLVSDNVFRQNEWLERSRLEGKRLEKARARHDYALDRYVQACQD